MNRSTVRAWAVRVAGATALGFQLWLWGTAGATPADAVQNPEHAFDEANRLYERGDFESAAAAYGRMLAEGPGCTPLHFNLGNALFKSGQLGRAIWHYRAAQDLKPRDADIRANLRFARNAAGRPAEEDRVRRWVLWLTVDEWSLASAVLFWMMMAAILVGRIRPQFRKSWRFGIRLLAVVWVLSLIPLGMALHGQFGRLSAIAIKEGAVHYGPFEESEIHFAVRDGTELTVLDAREGWLQVEDSSHGSGWIDRSLVLIYPSATGGS